MTDGDATGVDEPREMSPEEETRSALRALRKADAVLENLRYGLPVIHGGKIGAMLYPCGENPAKGDADTTELTEITDLVEARKGTYAVLVNSDPVEGKFRE